MSCPSPRFVIHQLAAALNSDEVEFRLTDILAPELMYNGQRLFADEVINILAPLRAATPDLHWKLEVVTAESSWASSLWTLTGTHSEDFNHPVLGRAPATGSSIRFVYSLYCRIENGRVVEAWDVSDRLNLFQQLRVLPVLGLGEGTHSVVAPMHAGV